MKFQAIMLSPGLPRWLSSKESACNAEVAGDLGSIRGLGRYPGEGNDNPFQYSCLKNAMDRGAWQATVHGVTQRAPNYKLFYNSINLCQY